MNSLSSGNDGPRWNKDDGLTGGASSSRPGRRRVELNYDNYVFGDLVGDPVTPKEIDVPAVSSFLEVYYDLVMNNEIDAKLTDNDFMLLNMAFGEAIRNAQVDLPGWENPMTTAIGYMLREYKDFSCHDFPLRKLLMPLRGEGSGVYIYFEINDKAIPDVVAYANFVFHELGERKAALEE